MLMNESWLAKMTGLHAAAWPRVASPYSTFTSKTHIVPLPAHCYRSTTSLSYLYLHIFTGATRLSAQLSSPSAALFTMKTVCKPCVGLPCPSRPCAQVKFQARDLCPAQAIALGAVWKPTRDVCSPAGQLAMPHSILTPEQVRASITALAAQAARLGLPSERRRKHAVPFRSPCYSLCVYCLFARRGRQHPDNASSSTGAPLPRASWPAKRPCRALCMENPFCVSEFAPTAPSQLCHLVAQTQTQPRSQTRTALVQRVHF